VNRERRGGRGVGEETRQGELVRRRERGVGEEMREESW
jgi:hypothetical protein